MSDASQISRKIDEIIAQRKIKAQELKARKEYLAELKSLMNSDNALVMKNRAISDEKVRKDCEEILKDAHFSMRVKKEIDVVVKKLNAGISRFERDSLNVATVGRARQGKSTFLQAVSNLGNDIIPAFDAGDCTGAVSIIRNDPSIAPGLVRVDITFRTKEELTGIVRDYIKQIDPDFLSDASIEFDDIGNVPLAEFESKIGRGDSKTTILLKHLRNIVDDFNGRSDSCSPSIRELCGEPGIVLTDPDEIRKYVAQNNGVSEGDPERENYYSYLAVKKAVISCQFLENVGKLVLVDTIGVGDTQVGIEDAMLDTVDSQCDAAIVVTKPEARIRTQDQDLYDSLRKKFKDRDTSKWLFYLANEQKGFNENAIDSFVSDVREKNFAVADCMKIDSKNRDEVRDGFLIPMLNKLIANMDIIDRDYMAEIDVLTAKLKQNILAEYDKFPAPKNMGSQVQIGIEVAQLGNECYNKLTADLARGVDFWYLERNKPNAILWNRVKDILDNLEETLPEEEKLQDMIDRSGTLIGDYIWMTPLNYVRNKITDQFIAIDKPMEEETLKFKNSMVKELYYSLKNLGGEDVVLSEDEEEDENTDYVKWLWSVLDPLIKDKPKYSQIHRAFKFLYQFEFNVRAELIREVRNQLGIINPMTPEYYMRPNYMFAKHDAGKSIRFYLTSRIAILEDGLRHSLSKMNKLPNQAFYAAAEEFYDRLTFASDLDNGTFVDMADIWAEFFTEYSQILWAEQVDKYKEMDALMAEYKNYRDAISVKLASLI